MITNKSVSFSLCSTCRINPFIKLNLSKFQTYDQDAIRFFYKDKVEELNYSYNYKPYWGNESNIKILHFHGPKPTFTDEDFKNFPYPSMVTPFFKEMTDKFNTIYDNYNLLHP